MAVIDFHTHILPEIDDGSSSVEKSLKMLQISAEQGVETIVATPHFYAWEDRIDRFLARRGEAMQRLAESLPEDAPSICVGSETAFFKGISRADEIEALTIGGGRVLLLEMPFHAWKPADLEEVEYLIEGRGLTIVLAHLERYFHIRENKKLIGELMDLPVYVQINAESLSVRSLRRRLLKMFADSRAHLLGSDCHSLNRRPPNLGEGRAVIENKLGREALDRIDRTGSDLLGMGGITC